VTEYLREYQPDIIGFQEVFSPESLKELVASQGYGYFEVVDQAEVIDDFIYNKWGQSENSIKRVGMI